MKNKFTIGEVFRLGLLLTKNGNPYRDKASVSNVLARYPHKTKKTAHGPAKIYDLETINKINERWD